MANKVDVLFNATFDYRKMIQNRSFSATARDELRRIEPLLNKLGKGICEDADDNFILAGLSISDQEQLQTIVKWKMKELQTEHSKLMKQKRELADADRALAALTPRILP